MIILNPLVKSIVSTLSKYTNEMIFKSFITVQTIVTLGPVKTAT